jgi:cellulose synthase/poly-beta-1,6-N-acetylglucosamine synthase-like glycosyltransferase
VDFSIVIVYWLLVDLPYLIYRTLLFLKPEPKHDLGEGPLPFVSVLMPAYNEERNIARALETVLAQGHPRLEIIVSDDGSTDRTREVAQNFITISTEGDSELIVTVIRSEKNQGKGRALNFALEQANGEIIVTVDGDTILAPRALRELVRPFSDPKVGAVAGTIKTLGAGGFLSLMQKVDYEIGIDLLRYTQSKFGFAMVTPGAFSAYRKSALQAFQLGTLTEDFDSSSYILKQGYDVRLAADAVAYTNTPSSYSQLIRQRVRWQQGGFEVYAKRNLFSSGILRGIEWSFIFFYGFVGVYNRLIALMLTPLLFFSSIILIPYFLVYSMIYWSYYGFLTLLRTGSIEPFILAPLYALYQNTVIAYATMIGQLRAMKRLRNWG